MKLREIAYARSGDKGMHANIGVIAYTEKQYQFLKEYLTEERVQDYFSKLGVSIPEGQLGINPGSISCSSVLTIIHAYGIPSGWEKESANDR